MLRNSVKWIARRLLNQQQLDDLKNWEFRLRFPLGVHYEPDLPIALRLVPVGGTVVDVGANVGQYAMAFSRRVGPAGRVLSFEPIPHVRARLEANARFFRATNISVYPYAVADRDGAELRLHTPYRDGRLAYQETSLVRIGGDDHVTRVQVRSLDALAIERCDFLKVDTEGAELGVLRGAHTLLERCRPLLLLEVNAGFCGRFGYTPEQLVDTLADLGYQPYQRVDCSLAAVPRRRLATYDGNIFFIRPDHPTLASLLSEA